MDERAVGEVDDGVDSRDQADNRHQAASRDQVYNPDLADNGDKAGSRNRPGPGAHSLFKFAVFLTAGESIWIHPPLPLKRLLPHPRFDSA